MVSKKPTREDSIQPGDGTTSPQEALRVSEERLRMAITSAAIGTWDYNPSRQALQCDAHCRRLFGLPPELDEDQHGVFISAVHPEDREQVLRAIRWALVPESGGHYSLEYRTIGLHDRRERWLSSQGRAYFDDAKQPVRFIGTVLDITQRKRAEASIRLLSEASRILSEQLEKPEDILRRVARLAVSSFSTYCIMSVVQEDGGLRRLAIAHRDVEKEDDLRETERFGPGPEGKSPLLEVVRSGTAMLVSDFSPELRRRYAMSPEHLDVMNMLDAQSLMNVPMRVRGKSIGLMILASAAPQRRFDKEDVALAQELASRVAVALENIRLYQEARQAVGLRDEFLSIASHELKTPLTSLKLQHELIRRSLNTECQSSVGPRLDAAIRQIDRLSTLMNSLLDVSRISSGHLRLEPVDMDLTQLAREVLERLSEMFSQAACSVVFTGPEPIRGRWDALRLDQVLVNLLSNAAKYGAGRPVVVNVYSRGTQAFLSVRDDGIGIAPKDVLRLFNRFERAVSERHYGGLGLGLYISKQIIEAMGGDIHVESEPGRGSTFTLVLPSSSLDAPGR